MVFHCTRVGPNSSRHAVSLGLWRSAGKSSLRPKSTKTHGFHFRLRHDLTSERKQSTAIQSCSKPVTLHHGVGSVCENNVNVAGVQNTRPTRCKWWHMFCGKSKVDHDEYLLRPGADIGEFASLRLLLLLHLPVASAFAGRCKTMHCPVLLTLNKRAQLRNPASRREVTTSRTNPSRTSRASRNPLVKTVTIIEGSSEPTAPRSAKAHMDPDDKPSDRRPT